MFQRSLPLLLSAALLGPATLSAQVIKKTDSGFCHPVESRYYDRIDEFTPFNTLQACEKSGGRLPGRLRDRVHEITVGVALESTDTAWSNSDYPTLDVRQTEMLKRLSLSDVKYLGDSQGQIRSGRWVSSFTLKSYSSPEELVVDYVVPLGWAWDHGAKNWSKEQRLAFASDSKNIWVVESDLSEAKGDQGPSQWMPPRARCGYISRFIRIVFAYGLERTDSEIKEHSRIISRCNRLGLE